MLKNSGFLLIVVSNQPEVARGRVPLETVERMHDRLRAALPLDDILVCLHDGEDNCACRKPHPGLLLEAQRRYCLDLSRSFLVGDRWRDVDAGNAAGAKTVLIERGYLERSPSTPPSARVNSLPEAVNWILRQNREDASVSLPRPELSIKLFADGADKTSMLELLANPWVRGFTTNPTLMRKAGVKDYEGFARDILSCIIDRPVSLEVFADEFEEIERQAKLIASWGPNVYVKIPITNTRGESALHSIRRLTQDGIRLNVTAILTLPQVRDAAATLAGGAPAFVSVFCGRIADTGRDPVAMMAAAREMVHRHPGIELVWASTRELLNIVQAQSIQCDIITVTSDILAKLALLGKDLAEYSRETVQMFFEDAKESGFTLSDAPAKSAQPRTSARGVGMEVA
jgi:transaldolase